MLDALPGNAIGKVAKPKPKPIPKVKELLLS